MATVPAFLDRPILFFGGKGGVGKTTLASALALLQAESGRRTLLVSTDPAHSLSDVLECSLGPEPRRVPTVSGELRAMELDPAREVEDYLDGVKRRIADVATPHIVREARRQIDLARFSPGAEESAVFERLTRLLEEAGGSHDRLVFDTAPTGHTLRLLGLPELMARWTEALLARRRQAGALRSAWRRIAGAAAGSETTEDPVLDALEERRLRFERARRTLTDGTRTGFVFVLVAEQLVVRETGRTIGALERFGIPVAGLVVNRVRREEPDLLGPLLGRFSPSQVARVPEMAEPVGLGSLRALAGPLAAGS